MNIIKPGKLSLIFGVRKFTKANRNLSTPIDIIDYFYDNDGIKMK